MFSKLISGVLLTAGVLLAPALLAATPNKGTVTMTNGLASAPLSYSTGPLPIANASPLINERDDYDCDELNPCDEYLLTIDLPTDFRVKFPAWRIRIVTAAVPAAADIDFQIRNFDKTLIGVVRDNPPAQPRFIYQPKGGVEVVRLQIVPGTPVPDASAVITLYEDPALVNTAGPAVVQAGGPNFVNYPYSVGSAVEPTMGVNIGTNVAYFINGLTVVRGAWGADNAISYSSLGNFGAVESLDPFLTVDQFRFDDKSPLTTNDRFDGAVNPRVWVAHLLGATSYIAYSDDDGKTFTRSLTGPGQVHGVDNESIIAGPYPIPKPLTAAAGTYEHAVYYCSHEAINAFCSRSDNGGATFGPSRPIFPIDAGCSNHGHVKVGYDGTVFVPMNNSCQGTEGVTLSIDGGETWHYIAVPGTREGRWDPSIAMANDGKTVWFGYAEVGDDRPMILKGILDKSNANAPTINWQLPATDVGVPAGLKNIAFSTVVAGDPQRAAFAFHGTTKPGNSGTFATFTGAEWFLYVATTFDGGKTWNLRNATPSDPTQRNDICDGGTGCATTGNHRNLLDFMDMDIDGEGRLVLIMADGCTGGCVTGAASYTARGSQVRQVDGQRMYAKFDPLQTAEPGTPVLSGTRSASGIALSWPAVNSGTGGSLSFYEVERSVNGAAFTNIGQPAQSSYTDSTAVDPTANYAYRIRAVNSGNFKSAYSETATFNAAGATASACTAPGVVAVTDAANDQAAPGGTSSDIRFVAVAEPYTTDADKSLTFTLKVTDLASVPVNTIWKVRFTVKDKTGTDRVLYVEMHTKDPTSLTPTFGYGWQNGTTDTGSGGAGVVSGSFKPDGSITIKFNVANELGFRTLGGATDLFKVLIEPGSLIGSITGVTQLLVGAQPAGIGGGSLQPLDATDAGSNYSVKGNKACSPNILPTASLRLVREYDAVPGASITADFDAKASTDADGTIAGYTFTFSDGTSVANTTGLATHTFNGQGGEAVGARVVVRDDRGDLSTPSTLVQLVIPAKQNNAPSATASSGSTLKNTNGLFTLAGSDADGDTLSFAVSSQPANGTVTLSGAQATYTPNTDFVGGDTFSFTVNDGKATSAPALFSVTVNDNGGGGQTGSTINAGLAVSGPDGQQIDPNTEYQAPLAVTFDASSTTVNGSTPAVFTFVFGDGNSMSQDCSAVQSCAVLNYVYEFAGTFKPYVLVTDAKGNNGVSPTRSVTTVVTVQVDPNGGATVAKLTLRDSSGAMRSMIRGESPLQVTMDGSASVARNGRNIVRYVFDFGDGFVVDGSNTLATHVYMKEGSYEPTLTIYDDANGTSTAKSAVAVNSAPTAVPLTRRSAGSFGSSLLIVLALIGIGRRRLRTFTR